MHLIESLVCFVNLSDKIYINKSKSKYHKIKFIGKFSKKITKKNTVTKLLSLLDKDNVLKNKYKILVKKEIPLQSGMGGGSMNAANLLNYFYKKKIINLKKLKKYSLKIGSDVILGLNSKPKILYRDGSIKEVTDIKKYHVLIVKPAFGCSTKKIYSSNKTFSKSEFNISKEKIVKNVILNGKNDLEKSVCWCANQGIKELELFGFSYGRDDHHLANLFIMKNFSDRIKMKMYTDKSLIFCINKHSTFLSEANQTVSIFTFNKKTTITTTGLKYPLKNAPLSSPSQGISNLSTGSGFSVDPSDWTFIIINYM